VEGLAGDGDPEVAPSLARQLQAGADQDVDALVGLDAAEEEDLERRPGPLAAARAAASGTRGRRTAGWGRRSIRSAGMPWESRWSRMFSVWGT
jgi:hypothetical protein